MIPDRIIEEGTLTTRDRRTAVEVRLPWYRSIPASCISEAELTVDGVPAPVESLRWTMNGTTYRLDELADRTDEWWFPTDSVVLEGDLEPDPTRDSHEVRVDLKVYIPYIVTAHGVLRIEEHDTKEMAVTRS